MSAVDFLDTNVLLYFVDAREPAKRSIARELIGQALAEGSAVISHQVVQETMHVLGSRFKTVVSRGDRDDLLREVLVPLWKVQPSPALVAEALDIQQHQGFGFYDSLIVAAAKQAGCSRLLTEDLQHGQRIGRLRVVNPFLAAVG